jgi:coproporphyrinogen III oxidase|tara:strand:+ start:730 stop:1557 length:828 start_codon:yes stop_codon:yes gene_type:complete
MKIEDKKKFSEKWFEYLQDQICDCYESIEKKFGGSQKFLATKWSKSKKSEGGGNYRILKAGKVFDKVGVNKSTVSGKFSKKFRTNILGAQKDGNYWASGISVVAHMKNPKIPAMHFNTRFIVTKKSWFGGGIDLTPSFKDKKEEIYFHSKLKELCNNNRKNYNKYKIWCDKYFFLKHRNEKRGIGGIFFDYEKKNWEKDFQFVREIGIGFIELSSHIINNKIKLKYNKRDKERQYLKRGRYIEFNLLYDRGTKFGLNSGGNTEAILMSLPPKAKW